MKNKKKLMLTGLLVIISLLIIGCATKFESPVQKIKLSTTSYDMGDIDPSKGKWTEIFFIKNVGAQPLEILAVSTSCGCTEAEVEDQEIAPGEQTKLLVTYDPDVHPGLTGPIKRVIYIKSNDPLQKEVELELTGNIILEGDVSGK